MRDITHDVLVAFSARRSWSRHLTGWLMGALGKACGAGTIWDGHMGWADLTLPGTGVVAHLRVDFPLVLLRPEISHEVTTLARDVVQVPFESWVLPELSAEPLVLDAVFWNHPPSHFLDPASFSVLELVRHGE